jgi:hypothetical protein
MELGRESRGSPHLDAAGEAALHARVREVQHRLEIRGHEEVEGGRQHRHQLNAPPLTLWSEL